MRLLNTKDLQQKKQAHSEVDLYKLSKIKKKLEEDILKLREYKDNFDPEKKKAIAEFSVFMKKMQEKKSDITKEIEELKEEREKILEPLIQEKLENIELGEISTKKRLINEKIDKLDRIEDDINARSLKLAEDERKLKNSMKVLKKKEDALESRIRAFDKFISNQK